LAGLSREVKYNTVLFNNFSISQRKDVMSKPYLWRLSLAAWGVISLVVIALTLAACGGAATTPEVAEEPAAASPTEAPVEEAEAVAQNTPTTEKAEPTPTEATEAEEAAEAAPEEAPQTASGPATCAPLEIPDSLISSVKDEDWAKGPATAPMTVIELGDFQ
jgi:hypothetical protein